MTVKNVLCEAAKLLGESDVVIICPIKYPTMPPIAKKPKRR